MTSGERSLERRIVRSVVHDLIAAGHKVAVFDGEELAVEATADESAVMAALFAADEEYLYVMSPGADGKMRRIGWVRLIHGNGRDVICDYTTNLEEALEATNRLTEGAA